MNTKTNTLSMIKPEEAVPVFDRVAYAVWPMQKELVSKF